MTRDEARVYLANAIARWFVIAFSFGILVIVAQ